MTGFIDLAKVLLTPEGLLLLGATILAVLCDWFPPIQSRYDTLTAGQKRFVMVVLLAISAVIVYGLRCFGLFFLQVCDAASTRDMVTLFLLALAVNQGVHSGTKPTKAGS